ncbi:hypothetical protein G7Z17_g10108 [Cylindrodendrum hubeiense]|uniref:Uncharacterized protein n=1 Tax=Cylindrodendrum hubeiense TaxID=595255 RepID=A0A9P5H6J7_9HYPO|nr:hypothetical protein G7Z17_g10108 [Cylindrodendrum hubeiense]
MGTRWATQSLHSASYPSSTSTHSLSSLPSGSSSFLLSSLPPFSPPHLPHLPLSTSLPPGSVSASVSASALYSQNITRLDPELTSDPHIRPRSTSHSRVRPRSRSRSSTTSHLSPSDILVNCGSLPSTVAMAERPAIYVHFEFGVAWTPRHASRNRQLTYMSKNMRDRANQFPRQLPPSNTNYLTNNVPYQQPSQSQPQTQPHQHQVPNQNTLQWHFPRDVVFVPPPVQQQQQQQQPYLQNHQWQALHPERTSRTQSRSSHERGRSAPPPLNNSPWDANPESSAANTMAHNLPRDQRPIPEPEIWKALPATPNQFRLGEDGMPWSSWTFPMGYADDDNDDNDEQGNRRRSTPQVSEISPESSRRSDPSDRDKSKVREMQSLAAALVTVDNGFEDQWWYQGPRLVNVAGNMLPTTAGATTDADTHDDADGTTAWVASSGDRENQENRGYQEDQDVSHPSWASFQLNSPRSSLVDIVSPVSEFSSPASGYQGLHRSLTTRSDELHM